MKYLLILTIFFSSCAIPGMIAERIKNAPAIYESEFYRREPYYLVQNWITEVDGSPVRLSGVKFPQKDLAIWQKRYSNGECGEISGPYKPEK